MRRPVATLNLDGVTIILGLSVPLFKQINFSVVPSIDLAAAASDMSPQPNVTTELSASKTVETIKAPSGRGIVGARVVGEADGKGVVG